MERDPIEMALSMDIVMDIVLSHLKARDLRSCRLASKFWNKSASSVLRKRSTMMSPILNENRLMELQECMKKSLDFPFAGLSFIEPWLFNSAGVMEFFRVYGARFTCLRLDAYWRRSMHYLAPFIDHLSHLSTLVVGWPYGLTPLAVESDVRQVDTKILKIPSVRTFIITSYVDEDTEDAIREVLMAASPSLQIECGFAPPHMLRAFLSVGKLRAISSMRFCPDGRDLDVMLEMEQSFSTETPSLTKLSFHRDGVLSHSGLLTVLFSSQHTLKELHLDGFNDLECLLDDCPVFTKLITLSMRVEIDNHRQCLFHGPHGHKFQALKVFKLEVVYVEDKTGEAVLSDGIFVVPSVTTIDMKGYVNADGTKKLAQIFPNATEVRLEYGYYSGDIDIMSRTAKAERSPFDIWSVGEFKFLEKLTIWGFTIKRPKRNYINMDSFLTGIPCKICENLHKQKQLISHLINSPFKQAFYEALRVHPSILQLKSLTQLIVCVNHEDGFVQLPEDTPLMSMLSVWYALEMMPNLRAEFVYEGRPRFDFEKPKKEALEAAFKHVEQYVKLEPFFY